jgi:hypothetical protein
MKHKLKIEDLAVESFVVASDSVRRGTVRGFARPVPSETELIVNCQPTFERTCETEPVEMPTIEEWTCVEDLCQPTFGESCIMSDCCVKGF